VTRALKVVVVQVTVHPGDPYNILSELVCHGRIELQGVPLGLGDPTGLLGVESRHLKGLDDFVQCRAYPAGCMATSFGVRDKKGGFAVPSREAGAAADRVPTIHNVEEKSREDLNIAVNEPHLFADPACLPNVQIDRIVIQLKRWSFTKGCDAMGC
jgi:hypothetical protein